jgi:hypothetical protein
LLRKEVVRVLDFAQTIEKEGQVVMVVEFLNLNLFLVAITS